MAMLDMLRKYSQEVPFSLCAVHVHHGIRGEEADRDEALVQDTCRSWGIPFLSYHYPVLELSKKWKMGTEETGRKVRQEAFARAKQDFRELQGEAVSRKLEDGANPLEYRIALAHNENDAAETLIHNLCRGTGLKGLGGDFAGKRWHYPPCFVFKQAGNCQLFNGRAYTLYYRQYQPDRGIHPEPYPSQDSSPSGK